VSGFEVDQMRVLLDETDFIKSVKESYLVDEMKLQILSVLRA